MSKPWIHALSSAKRFGGVPEDYIEIHNLMDSSKATLPFIHGINTNATEDNASNVDLRGLISIIHTPDKRGLRVSVEVDSIRHLHLINYRMFRLSSGRIHLRSRRRPHYRA